MPRYSKLWILALFAGTALRVALAVEPQISVAPDLSVYLSDERGNRISELAIGRQDLDRDILFRYSLGTRPPEYVSWALEVSHPEKKLFYQMAFEGKIPAVLHWDGIFASGVQINTNEKYLIRLVLVTPDNRILSSPWSFFVTVRKVGLEIPKIAASYIDLYIIPTGGLHYTIVQSQGVTAALIPNIFGDFRMVWKNDHTFGIRFDVTSNTLFAPNRSDTGFFYSDFSTFYRYRLLGAPVRPPVIPSAPRFVGYKVRPALPDEAYGKPTNAEVGVRAFYSTLRGYPGTPLDNGLAKLYQGFSLTFNGDQAIYPLRVHGAAEIGYSMLLGSILVACGELGVTYDQIPHFAPGLQLRYTYLAGTSLDSTGTTQTVSNSLIFAGLVIYFKL